MERSARTRLNYDILLEVMAEVASVSIRDCMRMMRSCRCLYVEGIKVLLSQEIMITEQKLLSFLAFLRVGDDVRPRRHSLVRALTLSVYHLTEDMLPQLFEAIPLLNGLRYLDLDCGETFLGSHPGLADAFAALTTLRELHLFEIGPLSMRLLRTLQSHIVVVDLTFFAQQGLSPLFEVTPQADWSQYHPVLACARFAPTLQKLTAMGWYTNPEFLTQSVDVFPDMRSLELDCADLPRIITYIYAYPNLSYLYYQAEELEGCPQDPQTFADCRRHHRRNLDEQLKSGRTWEKLQHFCGTVPNLYTLGLACLIDRLELYCVEDDLVDMLATVLSYARPKHLELGDWPGLLTGPQTCVFTQANSARLQKLSIRKHFRMNDPDFDVAVALENLRTSLESAPLQVLQIQLCLADLGPYPRRGCLCTPGKQGPPPSPPGFPPVSHLRDYPLCLAEHSVHTFDLEDYLRRFAETVPSLQQVTVFFDGPRNLYSYRTMKARDDGILRMAEPLGW